MKTLNHKLVGPKKGEVILFLHGFMGSSADWDSIVEPLSEKHRCLTVDLPGHGKTPVEPYADIDALMKALIALIDSLGIEHFHTVGYSMGGRVAFQLMRAHSERLQSVFLISASPGFHQEDQRIARCEQDEELAKKLLKDGLEPFLQQWYELPLFRALHWHPRQFSQMLERRRQNDPKQLAEVLRRFGTGNMPDCWATLEDSDVRFCFLAGDVDDRYVTIAQQLDWLCPHAHVEVIMGCGHTVHVEEPSFVCSAIRRWLEISREDYVHDYDTME